MAQIFDGNSAQGRAEEFIRRLSKGGKGPYSSEPEIDRIRRNDPPRRQDESHKVPTDKRGGDGYPQGTTKRTQKDQRLVDQLKKGGKGANSGRG